MENVSPLASASCAISLALVAMTFCVVTGFCPVDGWTLAAMVGVSVLSIGGILHTHKEGQNGQTREG